MSKFIWLRPANLAMILLLILMLPFVKNALEASMTTQMLVQIPLLVLVGWLLQDAIPKRLVANIAAWNSHGMAGLILTMFAAAYWMLPRTLDAATGNTLMAMAKYSLVPLLIGLPLALSWPRMNFIIKGVLMLEFIATLFRLGWLYATSPSRLCNNYLLGDQQRLGQYMLIIGAVLLAWIMFKLLFGRFEARATK